MRLSSQIFFVIYCWALLSLHCHSFPQQQIASDNNNQPIYAASVDVNPIPLLSDLYHHDEQPPPALILAPRVQPQDDAQGFYEPVDQLKRDTFDPQPPPVHDVSYQPPTE